MIYQDSENSIAKWTALDYAEIYRKFIQTRPQRWCVHISAYLPKELSDEEFMDLYEICKRFYNQGF